MIGAIVSMKLPIQSLGVHRDISVFAEDVFRDKPTNGVVPQVLPTIPASVALALARDYSIDQITGAHPQCIATVVAVLNDYQRCLDSGRNVNCENIAARHLKEMACVYCSCPSP